MRILLVGEYSRLHNSLKEGLLALGHEVLLISTGDYFKDYPSDIKLKRRFDTGWLKKIKVGIYKIFNIDITSFDLKNQVLNIKDQLIDFDVVQLINESPFGIQAKYETQIITFLAENNTKLFLLCCGNDFTTINYSYQKNLRYSSFTPYFEKKMTKKDASSMFKYLKKEHRDLHDFLYKKINGVIASDIDYHIPLKGKKQYLGIIANPINVDKLKPKKTISSDEIIVFHGINRANYFKKGNDLFHEAIKQIKTKYETKVKIIEVADVPYSKYIKLYESAHIILDQVYSYDQGYNALEAMAQGKVVLTGAEKEFLDHYNIKEDEVCINVEPNVQNIVEKLSKLIESPDKVKEIGGNARNFILKEHNYIRSANKYASIWKKH